jgi:phosphoribosylaminoimidazole carboxylase (NCAIR synthetase)
MLTATRQGRSAELNTGRPSVLLVGADPYVLRACDVYEINPVLLCNSGAYDDGRIRMPERGTLIRVDDVTNPEDCLAALYRAGLADLRFEAVQTTWEYSVVTAAVLGRALGCRSIDPGTALHFRDKSLQKGRLRSAGVPVTRTVVIDDIYDVSDVPLEFDRAVLKPIAGGGTTSTSMVRERRDLEEKSRDYREQRVADRTFLLEEFVAGDEWMAEGVVFGGEVLFFALGAYTEPCLEAVSSQVPISLRRLDPVDDAEAYEKAGPVVRKAIAALGLRDSVFHMELFHEHGSGRVIFSECAARRGGALTQEQVLAKFNVDLGEAALLCALGRRPEIDVKVHSNLIGCVGLYGPAGTLVSYPTPAEMMDQPNVTFAQTWAPLGSNLSSKFSATAEMICAMLLVTGSVAEFDERVVQLRHWFGERLVVAEPGLTNGQRRAWQLKHWPDRDYEDRLYDGG